MIIIVNSLPSPHAHLLENILFRKALSLFCETYYNVINHDLLRFIIYSVIKGHNNFNIWSPLVVNILAKPPPAQPGILTPDFSPCEMNSSHCSKFF